MNDTVNEFLLHETSPMITNSLQDKWNIHENTIALIPFTTTPGSLKLRDGETEEFLQFSQDLRLLYLKATVLSVRRYFPKIVISVCSDRDLLSVKSLNLPIWKYFDLSNKLRGRSQMLLPKESMLKVYNSIIEGRKILNEWTRINYLYYTEGDQILYARGLPKLYEMMRKYNNSIVAVPHRMHVSFM